MPTVTPDLVNGHTLNEVLGGFDVSQIYRITELTADPHLQLIEAAQTPGVPILNDAYDPAWPKLLCVNRDFEPDGPNAARAIITFSTQRNVSTWNQPDPPTNDGQDVKQIASGTRPVKRIVDRNGVSMVINPPATLTGYPAYTSEADVFLPLGQITFERVEQAPPSLRMRSLVGRVNSSSLGGYAVNSLLFRSLDAISEDGGNTWRVTYTFEYDGDEFHQHGDSYHGPDGKVPADATFAAFAVLLEADFTPLGLDWSDSQTPIG